MFITGHTDSIDHLGYPLLLSHEALRSVDEDDLQEDANDEEVNVRGSGLEGVRKEVGQKPRPYPDSPNDKGAEDGPFVVAAPPCHQHNPDDKGPVEGCENIRRNSLGIVGIEGASYPHDHGAEYERLHLKFEDCALYMSKHDADYLNGENAAWLNFESDIKLNALDNVDTLSISYFDSRYVTVIGVFNYEKAGHMGSFCGTIEKIEEIFETRQWYDGKIELWEDKLDGKGLQRINK